MSELQDTLSWKKSLYSVFQFYLRAYDNPCVSSVSYALKLICAYKLHDKHTAC